MIKQELFVLRNSLTVPAPTHKTKVFEPAPVDDKETKKPASPVSPPPQSASYSERTAVPRVKPPVPPPKRTPVPPPKSAPVPPPKSRSGPPPKRTTPPPEMEPPKILYIGDSISANVDIGALKLATQAEITRVKAYSSVHDTVSIFQLRIRARTSKEI